MRLLLLPVATALISLVASPAEAEPLQPTTRWGAGLDGGQCLAMRDFGTAHLVLKAYGIGPGLDISLIEDEASVPNHLALGVVGVAGTALEVPARRFTDNTDSRLVSTWMLPDVATIAQAETLTLAIGERTTELALGTMAPLVAALEKCRSQLQAEFGIGGEDPPVLPRGEVNVFKDIDYAAIASDPEVPSRFRTLLLLDEEGDIVDCSLIEHEGDPAALGQACTILSQEARFEPARGADGSGVRAIVDETIEWSVDVVQANLRHRQSEMRNRGYDNDVRGSDLIEEMTRQQQDQISVRPSGRDE